MPSKPSVDSAKPKSILEIRPGKPFNTYPPTLSAPPWFAESVRNLQRDNKLTDQGSEVIVERAAIVTRSGTFFPLPKEEHIRLLGDGSRVTGVSKAKTTSPLPEAVMSSLLKTERDPSVLLCELSVHTHPAFSTPSPEDILVAARRPRSVFTPSKSLVAGARSIFLIVPTRETWNMKAAEVNAAVSRVAAMPYRSPRQNETFDGPQIERGAAEAAAVRMHVYAFSDTDSTFHRVTVR